MSELSSDILEEQFGPTRITILRQKGLSRVITTKTPGGQVLELSRVEFNPEGIKSFAESHLRVVGGESMGKVFRDGNIEFQRDVRARFRYSLPEVFGKLFGSYEPATVVNVVILVGPARTPYARILETYTPLLKKYHVLNPGKPDDQLLEQIQLLDDVLGA